MSGSRLSVLVMGLSVTIHPRTCAALARANARSFYVPSPTILRGKHDIVFALLLVVSPRVNDDDIE